MKEIQAPNKKQGGPKITDEQNCGFIDLDVLGYLI
jgi:hypothetical protein